jgi:hypothetical protein
LTATAIIGGAAAVSVIALAIVALPALVLGYCAGRLQTPAAPQPEAPGDAMDEDDADLALACDTDAPRLLVASDGADGNGANGRL